MCTQMKKNRIIYVTVVFMLLAGCKDYLDINENPNEPTTAPLSSLMATSTFFTADNVSEIGYFTSYYVQYLASPNPASSSDIQDAVAYDDEWFKIYRALGNIADIEVLATENGATQYLGAAKILKALNLMMAVDVWGDLPYTDALLAQTLSPTYDDDRELYGEIFQLLSDGIDELNKEGSTFELGDDDFIYGGDIENWVKMGYALRARALIHLSETDLYDPQAVLNAVDNGFTGNDENATVVYFETEFNPWASVAISQENLILDGWISQHLVETLDGTIYGVVDPRMPYLFGATDEGEFIGVPNGAGRGTADVSGDRSVLERGLYYTRETSPLLIITYAEQKFIEAEAALDAGLNPRAYTAYLEGIRAHMAMLGVPTAVIDDYINSPQVSVGAGNLTIDLIMKEKYIALFLHPETWNDARRFDFQYEDFTIPANLNPDLNGNFARRFVYPDSETTRNGLNVPEVTQLTPIFWDVQ